MGPTDRTIRTMLDWLWNVEMEHGHISLVSSVVADVADTRSGVNITEEG